jgi:hypothetical protein
MFITIKHKIIHQCLTDGDKTVREETRVVRDPKCEIGVSLEGVLLDDVGLLGSDSVSPGKLFPRSEGT